MIEEQKTINIPATDLPKRVEEFYADGFRLVQVSCTKLADAWEMNYSFGKDFKFVNLRFALASIESEIPSVSDIYWSAFLYENEIADLFGLKFKNMAIDYKGNFYRTRVKQPFNQPPVNKSEVK
jgi:ech hydrogenase subunit D